MTHGAGRKTAGRSHRLATVAVLGWARLYTAVVPAPVRVDRRDELASDLCDHLADLRARRVSPAAATIEILRRLVAGMPDDLAWALTTMEHTTMKEDTMARMRTLAVAGWAFALVTAALGLWTAAAGLADGWRELTQHWWSALAVAGVIGAAVGLALTVVVAGRRTAGTG